MALGEAFPEEAGAKAQARPPEKRAGENAGNEHAGARQGRGMAAEAERGEDAEKGKNGDRVRDRQREGGEIGAEEVIGAAWRPGSGDRALAQRRDPDPEKEEATRRAQPGLPAQKPV